MPNRRDDDPSAPKVSQMTPEDRKIDLYRRKVTISDLARAIGLERQRGNVSEVIHGRLHREDIKQKICEYLGVDRAEWFPPVEPASVDAAA